MADRPKHDLGKRMMNQAVIVLALIGVVIYFVYFGEIQPEENVAFEVTLTQEAPTAASAAIPLTVAITLTNNTKEGIALTSDTQCNVFNWFLTGTDKEFVQSKQEPSDCTNQTVSTWLDSKHAMKQEFTLQLDPARVHPGDYLLFLRYWGHEVTENVTIK